jgi:hypothetical protein
VLTPHAAFYSLQSLVEMKSRVAAGIVAALAEERGTWRARRRHVEPIARPPRAGGVSRGAAGAGRVSSGGALNGTVDPARTGEMEDEDGIRHERDDPAG